MSASAEQVPRDIPREEPCPRCGCTEPEVNGAWCRERRLEAKVTLAQISVLSHISITHLSRMELGQVMFKRSVAQIYERLFERRRKAGAEQD